MDFSSDSGSLGARLYSGLGDESTYRIAHNWTLSDTLGLILPAGVKIRIRLVGLMAERFLANHSSAAW
jgi:hypothetical protein